MDVQQLTALRDRLAKATGPDRLLDRAIAETALGKKLKIIEVPKGHPVFQEGGGLEFMESISGWTGIPPYTASIDAAVTLVPEGALWAIAPGFLAGAFEAEYDFPNNEMRRVLVDAGTPALALCLARIEYELAKVAK